MRRTKVHWLLLMFCVKKKEEEEEKSSVTKGLITHLSFTLVC